MKGPSPWLIGIDTLIHIKRDQLGFYGRMQAKYGDAVPLRLGPYRSWLLFHPDQIEAVLATHGRSFIRFEKLINVLRQWNGESLLIAEGQSWRDRRRRVLPAFSRKALPAYAEIFKQTAEDWSSSLLCRCNPVREVQVDADVIFAQISLDIALRALFGRVFTHEMEKITAHINTLSEVAFQESTSPLTLPDALPLAGKNRKRRAVAGMKSFVKALVEDRLQNPGGGDLLSILVETHDGMPEPICEDAMSLLIAGHETSGAALAWLFALLAQHPEIADRCYDEITTDANQDWPVLRASICETLRLYPPAYALFLRRATETVDAAGVPVRQGDLVQILPYATGRDARFFDDPTVFRPDRFLKDSTWPKYAYIPFGAGPRFCIGEQFALQEITWVTAVLLRHFEPSLVGSFPTPIPVFPAP